MDAQEAWPNKGYLHLDGFTFARFGGFAGETGPRRAPAGCARGTSGSGAIPRTARRPTSSSPPPWSPRVTVPRLTKCVSLAACGNARLKKIGGRGFSLDFFNMSPALALATTRFGVLYWVIGISVPRRAVSLEMRAGGVPARPLYAASAPVSNRLLPVIEVNKEFTEFFNDPGRTRLTGWQSFVFSFIGIVGWVLWCNLDCRRLWPDAETLMTPRCCV